ncbi:uncharacterized protein LOC113503881 [Trichoplusia ni]|uniref:Uncharacterized protein LOC113503881 n=1 Tax=Trichoplusia ni TaxID=7111 RepID=A0A7E5WM58_TRINI|nr:uncharacterized protein LOC113503881 [Trichoplusia ni]
MCNSKFSNLFRSSCVDQCCFCFTPRTGCLIIGYVYVVLIISSMILSSVPFFTLKLSEGATQFDADLAYFLVYMFFVVMMIICFIYMAFTINLLIGLHQHKQNRVRLFINFLYLASIGYIVFSVWYWFTMDFYIVSQFFIPMGIILSFHAYCILVLSIYHKKMLEVGTRTVIYTAS